MFLMNLNETLLIKGPSMSNEQFKENVSVKRVECISSRESSFYTLSNRLIVPLLFISLVTFIPVSRIPILACLCLIVIEVIIRYLLKTTMKDLIIGTVRYFFGSKIKNIRN